MPKTIRTSRHELLVDMIAAARKRSGLTQVEVAAQLGRHQPFIANIEAGQRRVDLIELIDLAEIIGLDLGKLLRELKRVPR